MHIASRHPQNHKAILNKASEVSINSWNIFDLIASQKKNTTCQPQIDLSIPRSPCEKEIAIKLRNQ